MAQVHEGRLVTNARVYAEVMGSVLPDKRSGLHFTDGSQTLPWTGDFRREGPLAKKEIDRCIKALARVRRIPYLEAAAIHRAAQEIWLELARRSKKNDRMRGRYKTAQLHEEHIALVDELINERGAGA